MKFGFYTLTLQLTIQPPYYKTTITAAANGGHCCGCCTHTSAPDAAAVAEAACSPRPDIHARSSAIIGNHIGRSHNCNVSVSDKSIIHGSVGAASPCTARRCPGPGTGTGTEHDQQQRHPNAAACAPAQGKPAVWGDYGQDWRQSERGDASSGAASEELQAAPCKECQPHEPGRRQCRDDITNDKPTQQCHASGGRIQQQERK